MRKITKDTASALRNNTRKSFGNTTCTGTCVLLHGNEIARVIGGKLEINLAGWPTTTTRERLNGILSEFGSSLRLHQSQHTQYLGDEVMPLNAWVQI